MPAPSPKALVTLDEARAWLNVSGVANDDTIQEEINRASEIIERYCERPLRRTADLAPATVRLSGVDGRFLELQAPPIDLSRAVTVSVDGITQTVWRSENDGDPENADVVVGYIRAGMFHPGRPERSTFLPDTLFRRAGWSTSRLGGIVVSYWGGLEPVPDDLKEACLYLVQKLVRDRDRQLADLATVSGPFGSISILDTAMPGVAREILHRYARRALALA